MSIVSVLDALLALTTLNTNALSICAPQKDYDMIKKLIEKTADESTSLTSALNQARIIAAKVCNEDLKNWLQYELKGYPFDTNDPGRNLPDYRTFQVDTRGDVVDLMGIKSRDVPILMDELGEQLGQDMSVHHERNNIPALEDIVNDPRASQFVVKPFQPKLLEFFRAQLKRTSPGLTLVDAGRYIAVSQLKNILTQTRQRLLDVLLELDQQFPDLEDKFVATPQNKAKVQNIFNVNVNAGSTIGNLGVGETVTQNIKKISLKAEAFGKKLRELGVPEEDVQEATEIVAKGPKESIGRKLMLWAGKLAAKAIEKGVDYKIPAIMEAVEKVM